MSAPAPSPPGAAPAAPPPAGAAPKAPPSAATPPTPLAGEIVDSGMVRRDAVRALRWTARGGGVKVLGDVEIDVGDVDGLVTVRGALKARQLRSHGSLAVRGAVSIGEILEGRGPIDLSSTLAAGALDLRGPLKVAGAVTVQGSAVWTGAIDVGADLAADSLKFEGSLQVAGDVAAPTIEGTIRAPSSVGNLRAKRLVLHRPAFRPPILPKFLPMPTPPSLRVLRIDADTVYLEGVDARFVKAESVTLGPGCHVAQIEGRLVSVHPSSHVGPESRSPRPYGMWR